MGWFRRWRTPVGVLAAACVLAAGPAFASDALTMNNTGLLGAAGGIYAAPPGSCTATPGGTTGDCSARGTANMEAAAGLIPGYSFFDDNTWSDLEHAPVPLTENGNTEVGLISADGTVVPGGASPSPSTAIGISWVPAFCSLPDCGHLLRGDVLQFDENGDGVLDNTWIDKNTNGVRDVGEVDRARGEQFQWGLTSLVRDLGDLSDQLATGNLTPPGLARTRVRIALGAASQGGCDIPSISNPACLDGSISSDAAAAGGFIDDNTINGSEVDPDWWGVCDPDRFDPSNADRRDLSITTVDEGQKALNNCLWWISSMPIFATDATYEAVNGPASSYGAANNPLLPGDPTHVFEQHTEWIDQGVVTYVNSNTPDRQDFAMSMAVGYTFLAGTLTTARYVNDWQLLQQDGDPNTNLNGPVIGDEWMGQVERDSGQPWNAIVVDSGANRDTYPYAFAVEHTNVARRRGYNNGPLGSDIPVGECGDAQVIADGDCTGEVNMTVDPFWRAQLVNAAFALDGASFNQDFEYEEGQPCETGCRTSGIGHEQGFAFLTAQDVNGYFAECAGCDEPVVPLMPRSTYMPYEYGWDVVPTIVHGGE
jgi:hypothetical protein